MAGVNPFAPTFDTVGILASSGAVLARAASVLLGQEDVPHNEPSTVHLLREAFSVADPEVRRALDPLLERLRHLFGERLRETSLREIDGESEEPQGKGFQKWYDTYCVLQWAEIESCLGAWVAAANPAFGPETEQNFELVKNLDRRQVRRAAQHREEYFLKLKAFLGPNDLLCIPPTPALAPLKATIGARGHAAASDYYPRTLSLTSVAGIGRLPQVSLPLAESGGVPVGLSLLAANGRDALLLDVVGRIAGFMSR